ncbi:hypothetical protein GH754_05835 [Salinibacillus xinjiangensis]|uniref:Uncharacterized protein n=1 Tax=Salinibacillus xinjiangensis TaxID=1229268 RepID=A0A6G1X4N1_9BACI|nr:hypothetical protein [Salinibacillus xinjiangensis]
MVLDESNQLDEKIEVDGLSFQVNSFTKSQVGDPLIIDYKPNYGFVIKNNNEVFAHGVKLQNRQNNG